MMDDEEERRCPECGGPMVLVVCRVCDGDCVIEHDCGEDSCCCVDAEDDECEECQGEGGYWTCKKCVQ